MRIDAYLAPSGHRSPPRMGVTPPAGTSRPGAARRAHACASSRSSTNSSQALPTAASKSAFQHGFAKTRSSGASRSPSPARLADIWNRTLHTIAEDGLLDSILFVDYCNEWPQDCWAPFFRNDGAEGDWTSPRSLQWMREALDRGREAFPDLSYCFSFANYPKGWEETDLGFMDLLEPHVWMANSSDFYDRLGYTYQRFSSEGFDRIVRFAEPLYRADPAHWQGELCAKIDAVARWSAQQGKPLVTTECWGPR